MKWHKLLSGGLLGLALLGPAGAQTSPVAKDTPASAPAVSTTTATAPATGPVSFDDSLQAAKAYVAQHSDRYLDHNKLSRGMKGYGLTVMAGTEIKRFDVEVVSVMTRWGPQQDVVLAKLSGLDLEKSGIIAGMSGSPCYFRDADGKDKLVGAVAFGWSYPKEPLCGIQPITQMLAVSGFLNDKAPAADAVPEEGAGLAKATADKEYLRTYLSANKLDFVKLGMGSAAKPMDAPQRGKATIRPLVTPLMVSGQSERARLDLAGVLKPMNVLPVQAGAPGGADAAAAKNVKLAPGSGVSIPLVSGDADISAVGTVTEVVGDKVLIFGHMFFALGDVSNFPMGPAYVHTIVSGYEESFKLASALEPVGTLWTDETTGVSGKVGPKSPMIPVTISVWMKSENRKQDFHYKVVRSHRLTPVALRYCMNDAAAGWRAFPENHTLRYNLEIDFGKLGVYRCGNFVANDEIFEAVSDATRPIMALLRNPFGQPIEPKAVRVEMVVEQGAQMADISRLDLEGDLYRPGDVVQGFVTMRPFKQDEKKVPVRLKLPADLPDGSYTITACDATKALRHMQVANPHRFDPKNVDELFEALRTVVAGQYDDLYLCMPLRHGGLTLGAKELPDLPDSKAQIIHQAGLADTHAFSQTLFTKQPVGTMLSGCASATFTVKRNLDKTLLRP